MAKERRPLGGKVVAITGGARGIGKTTAIALVRKGCKVAIGDVDLAAAEETAAELGNGAIAVQLDVTDRDSFEGFIEETEKQLGPLDVLINNAGVMPVTPFIDESEDSIVRQIDINLHGVVSGTQIALRRMMPRRTGHVVNIASIAGKAGGPAVATYTATKHGVVGLCEAVRAELRGTGIEISCVMPFPVRTALMEGVGDQRILKLVEPEEVANEVVNALEVPRFDVFVPRWVGISWPISSAMPRRAREAMFRFMGADKLLTSIDPSARRAYEERVAQSRSADGEPEAEPAAQKDAA